MKPHNEGVVRFYHHRRAFRRRKSDYYVSLSGANSKELEINVKKKKSLSAGCMHHLVLGGMYHQIWQGQAKYYMAYEPQ